MVSNLIFVTYKNLTDSAPLVRITWHRNIWTAVLYHVRYVKGRER